MQRVALTTDDILDTVVRMRRQGVEFMSVPRSYYTRLSAQAERLQESVEELEEFNILVDRDSHGYMLQAFTRPVEDRPTLFFEVVQRKGCRSFGKGSARALAEAVEREARPFGGT